MSIIANRESYKPFMYPYFYDQWRLHESLHWLPQEINYDQDVYDWKNKLNQNEKTFLTSIFRFFTQGDINVAGAYVHSYLPLFKHPEIRMCLLGIGAREAIHVDAYSTLIETLGMPDSIYEDFLKFDETREKYDFLNSYITPSTHARDIAKQIAVFSAFTEGLHLFSTFAMLLNFPRHNKMKGMGQVISWSIRDEQVHVNVMMELFRLYVSEHIEIWTDDFKKELYDICRKMVSLEDSFIDMCFKNTHIEGMTPDDLKQYIRYIADQRLYDLGLKPNYNVPNPFDWINEIVLAKEHTNFFENRSTAYSRGAMSGSWESVFPLRNE